MSFLKKVATGICLTIALGAHAGGETKPFACRTTLEYRLNNEILSVDLEVYGERSKTNTLNGKGLFIKVGGKSFVLNLPSVKLSDSVVIFKGTNLKEQASVQLTYLENSDGSQNLSNAASVSIRSKSGSVIVASNGPNDVVCDITK